MFILSNLFPNLPLKDDFPPPGSHHSRVGSILSALASVFHKRAQLGQNSGALIIAEVSLEIS